MMRLNRLIGATFVVLCVTATLCAQNRSTRQITVAGITNLSAQPGSAPAEVGNEVFIGPEVDEQFTKPQITGAISPARVSSAHVPTPGGSAFASTAGDVFTGFNALSHRDQRLSNNGNQFSLEPPDQGLAVGNGFVVDADPAGECLYCRKPDQRSHGQLDNSHPGCHQRWRSFCGVSVFWGPTANRRRCKRLLRQYQRVLAIHLQLQRGEHLCLLEDSTGSGECGRDQRSPVQQFDRSGHAVRFLD